MRKPKTLFLFFVFMALSFRGLAGQVREVSLGGDSVVALSSEDELILFNMINDLRRQNGLSLVPLSNSLCYVAHVHIADMLETKPEDNGCGLQAWSGMGKWTACCNTQDAAGIQCMKLKPWEIAGYPGDGYELISWGEDRATPIDAATLWKDVAASSDMILGKGKWKEFRWKAMGVGIKGGYAVLWLGEKADNNAQQGAETAVEELKNETKEEAKAVAPIRNEKKAGKKNAKAKQDSDEGQAVDKSKYYVIIFSNKSEDEAKLALKKFKEKGHAEAFIVAGERGFRIALAGFDTPHEASIKMRAVKKEFPQVWVLRQ